MHLYINFAISQFDIQITKLPKPDTSLNIYIGKCPLCRKINNVKKKKFNLIKNSKQQNKTKQCGIARKKKLVKLN